MKVNSKYILAKMNLSKLSLVFSLLLILFLSACNNESNQQDTFYSVEDFQSVEKIDAHVHLNVANPVVIEQGIEDNMKMITLNVANGRSPVSEQQQVALELQEDYSDRLQYTSVFPWMDLMTRKPGNRIRWTILNNLSKMELSG